MNTDLKNKSGLTLVEVLISMAIMLAILPFAATTLASNGVWSSYSKHKIEAAYAAEQIIEMERQLPFATLSAITSSTAPVILDTKGNYNNSSCATNAFCGSANIKVTAEAYYNSVGVKTTSATVDHVQVAISWYEQSFGKQFTETYAADVVNDPMLN